MREILKSKITRNYKTEKSRNFWKELGKTIHPMPYEFQKYAYSEKNRETLQRDRHKLIVHCILELDDSDCYWVKLFLNDKWRRLPYMHPDEEGLF